MIIVQRQEQSCTKAIQTIEPKKVPHSMLNISESIATSHEEYKILSIDKLGQPQALSHFSFFLFFFLYFINVVVFPCAFSKFHGPNQRIVRSENIKEIVI